GRGAPVRRAGPRPGALPPPCPAGAPAGGGARARSGGRALAGAVWLFVGLLGSALGLWPAPPADKPPVRKTDGSGQPPKPADPRPRQQTWKERAVLPVGPLESGAFSADFSPDGKTVALPLVNGNL